PDIGVFVNGVFQLKQHQRQAVDKQDDVWTARMVWAFDGELVYGPEFVVLWVVPIHQANKVATGFTILLILHVYAVNQQLMKRTIGGQLNRSIQVFYLLDGIFTRCGGNMRVQAVDGVF